MERNVIRELVGGIGMMSRGVKQYEARGCKTGFYKIHTNYV
jgi:hypothetical protein